MGDSAWSLYLGKSSTTYQEFVSDITTAVSNNTNLNADRSALATALTAGHAQSNPLQLTYASKAGDISWGAGLFYLGNDYKTAQNFTAYSGQVEQNIAGLLLGANNGVWDAQLRVGLMGETKTTAISTTNTAASQLGISAGSTLEVNSTGSLKASGGYLMDTMYFYGGYDMRTGEVKTTGGGKIVDATKNILNVGVINSHKKDGVDFFYGAEVVMTTTEDDEANTKVESTNVPLIIGVEADATSWMTLRASVKQPLSLLSSTKSKGSSSTSVADGTVTALGAGFKWGKATIDTVVSTGTDGNFGTDSGGDIFGQASVTYNF